MDPQTANVSHLIFGPGPRTGDGRMQSSARGIIEALTIYHWPRTPVSDDSKLAVMAFFQAFGRSESVSPSAWATWMYTFQVLAFEEMKDKIRSVNDREFKFVQLPEAFINACVDVYNAALNYDDEHPEQYDLVARQIPDLPGLPELPRSADAFPPDYAATATIAAIYGYNSLLVFLAGKKINPNNATTITERRPMNLVDAYLIAEPSAFALTGDGKMGPAAHKYVTQAWITYAPARQAIITEMANFSAGTSLAQRVTNTMVRLMEYAGMQQATFIHEFLQAYPECVNYACIRPSYNAFVTSLHEVAAAPSYLQPFYKVIHGDKTRAFHRNAILNLSACATAWKKYVSTSMNNFTLGEGATAAVTLFDAEAQRRGHPTLQALTAPAAAVAEAE